MTEPYDQTLDPVPFAAAEVQSAEPATTADAGDQRPEEPFDAGSPSESAISGESVFEPTATSPLETALVLGPRGVPAPAEPASDRWARAGLEIVSVFRRSYRRRSTPR